MIKLAIDLGSSMTKIYRADTNSGIVLAEPSCVAVSGESDEDLRPSFKQDISGLRMTSLSFHRRPFRR